MTGGVADELWAYSWPEGSMTLSSNVEPGQPSVKLRSPVPSVDEPPWSAAVWPGSRLLVSKATGWPGVASAVWLKTVQLSCLSACEIGCTGVGGAPGAIVVDWPAVTETVVLEALASTVPE